MLADLTTPMVNGAPAPAQELSALNASLRRGDAGAYDLRGRGANGEFLDVVASIGGYRGEKFGQKSPDLTPIPELHVRTEAITADRAPLSPLNPAVGYEVTVQMGAKPAVVTIPGIDGEAARKLHDSTVISIAANLFYNDGNLERCANAACGFVINEARILGFTAVDNSPHVLEAREAAARDAVLKSERITTAITTTDKVDAIVDQSLKDLKRAAGFDGDVRWSKDSQGEEMEIGRFEFELDPFRNDTEGLGGNNLGAIKVQLVEEGKVEVSTVQSWMNEGALESYVDTAPFLKLLKSRLESAGIVMQEAPEN